MPRDPKAEFDVFSKDKPQDAFFQETPSQETRIKLDKVDFWTKLQWAALGTVSMAIAGFVVWGLATLASISDAQAQDKATSNATARDLNVHINKDAAEKVVIFQMFEEQRKDSKALYNAMIHSKKSKRLENSDAGSDEE